ncbi:MAG: hypothetical protein O3C28_15910 [Proteobacteria bacterium]|nr:hypothetical protein [Pseudomonadota bacterium]
MAAHEVLANRLQEAGETLDSLLVDVLEHAQEPILIVGENGQVLRVSTGASNLFGVTAQAMLLLTLDSLPWIDDVSKARPSLLHCIGADASRQTIVYEGVYINSVPSKLAKRFDLKIIPYSIGVTHGAVIFFVESRLSDRYAVEE